MSCDDRPTLAFFDIVWNGGPRCQALASFGVDDVARYDCCGEYSVAAYKHEQVDSDPFKLPKVVESLLKVEMMVDHMLRRQRMHF